MLNAQEKKPKVFVLKNVSEMYIIKLKRKKLSFCYAIEFLSAFLLGKFLLERMKRVLVVMSQRAEKKRKKPRNKDTQWKQDLFELLLKVAFIVITIAVSFIVVFGVMIMPDDSMSNSVKPGDIVFFYRLDKSKKLDTDTAVVVNVNDKLQVRRIVAGPNDEVTIKEEGLYVNGNLRTSTYAHNPTYPYQDGPKYPLKLGADQYFVLGDYRTDVEDSRKYGVVSQSQIEGSLVTLIRAKRF